MKAVWKNMTVAVLLSLSVFSQSHATNPQNESIVDRIVRGGAVDPNQYDNPRYLQQHRDALAALRSMSQRDLDNLANRYRKVSGQGKRIKEDWVSIVSTLAGGQGSLWDVAFRNYEEMLNQTLVLGVPGVTNSDAFALRGRRDLHAVNLIAAYINLGVPAAAPAAVPPAGRDVPNVANPIIDRFFTNLNAQQAAIRQPAAINEARIDPVSGFLVRFDDGIGIDIYTDPESNRTFVLDTDTDEFVEVML